ncbi:hypothetical protein TGRUB_431740 [Toxoplasma gondii RUB]|uniref:Uncharacterized protein n=1 Tax=Toxoplasma gondii RUB TaxID=935652 RepID=A0A086LW44_TOXGO|nr:hypothetical protein TGRUB_431740 [Toxoplasma gondii RUB]
MPKSRVYDTWLNSVFHSLRRASLRLQLLTSFDCLSPAYVTSVSSSPVRLTPALFTGACVSLSLRDWLLFFSLSEASPFASSLSFARLVAFRFSSASPGAQPRRQEAARHTCVLPPVWVSLHLLHFLSSLPSDPTHRFSRCLRSWLVPATLRERIQKGRNGEETGGEEAGEGEQEGRGRRSPRSLLSHDESLCRQWRRQSARRRREEAGRTRGTPRVRGYKLWRTANSCRPESDRERSGERERSRERSRERGTGAVGAASGLLGDLRRPCSSSLVSVGGERGDESSAFRGRV